MKKTIVLFYSNTGNNRFLAQKTAKTLGCAIEEIRPRIDSHVLILMGLSLGIRKIKADLEYYDRIILCGPIMVGKFLAPLKSFVKSYKKRIKSLIFLTCCGSSYEMKDKKFGHGLVFNQIKEILGEKCDLCQALPITLVVPEDKKEDAKYVMETRLSDENFKGEILVRFGEFIQYMRNLE